MASVNLIKRMALFYLLMCLVGCRERSKTIKTSDNDAKHLILKNKPVEIITPQGMVWVSGKTFIQGGKDGDDMAMAKEMPAHPVMVDGFFMDITEVTNEQFKAFVDATGYVTVAERPIDWDTMKLELPEDTAKPHDSVLQPGSLIFNKQAQSVVNMHDYGQWWTWKVGANWKHPEGVDSSIEGKDKYPVVHIAHEDALAYCHWANRKLPTEAQWESAAQGMRTNAIFTWGNDVSKLNAHANTWQGKFPTKNNPKDGFEYVAPVKSFPANSIGIYDMLGNVWEWTADLYNADYYKYAQGNKTLVNPKGAEKAFSTSNPYQQERVIKGGSFLCHDSYCASFRISAKMGMSPDSSSDHLGFRTVATVDMLD